ncbi:MAG: CoA transferase, partial [Burkholderiales bacterium]|nr:CoA transferase [Opitutaceae bacterium]
GVLAALYHRERTGEGQKIHVSLLASALAFQAQDFFTIHNLHRTFKRPNSGIGHPGNGAPFGIYQTSDGYLSIAMNPWPKIIEGLGDPTLARYNDPQVRFDSRDEIFNELQKIFLTRTTDEWLERLLALDLWVAKAQPQTEVKDDPQVKHMGLFTTVTHPTAGDVTVTNIPIQMSATPGEIRRPAPLIGQHGPEILEELGYTAAEVATLTSGKVITVQSAG